MKGERNVVKLTSSTTAKVIAVLLLIICMFMFAGSVFGAVFVFESGYISDESDRNYSGDGDGWTIMDMKNVRCDVINQYSSFITGHNVVKAAQNVEDSGSSIPYLKYWTKQDDLCWWDNMKSCRNLAVQVYDFSDGSVSYSENGFPAYGNQQAADDELYMYKKSAGSGFLLDFTKEEKALFRELEDQLYGIQIMPQEYADMVYSESTDTYEAYEGEAATQGAPDSSNATDSGTVDDSSKSAEHMGTYGMEFVGIKIFKDGMPEQRLNGKLLFDSDTMVEGSFITPEIAENVKGPTIAVMHRNGMVSFCTLREPLEYADYYWVMSVLHNLYIPVQNAMIPCAAVSGLLCVLLFIFLMVAAGRRSVVGSFPSDEDNSENEGAYEDIYNESGYEDKNTNSVNAENAQINEDSPDVASRDRKTPEKGFVIVPRWPERIPLDIFFAAVCCIICGVIGILAISIDNLSVTYGIKLASVYSIMVIAAVITAASAVLGIEFLMSCAVRFKLGKWWKNTLCYKICSWAWKMICRIARFAGRILNKVFVNVFGTAASTVFGAVKSAVVSIGVQWKLTAAAALVLILNVWLGWLRYWDRTALLAVVIIDVIIMLVILAIGLMLRHLEKGGKALASGDLYAKIDTSRMFGSFKRHGENLNSISDGMAIAIDERMRSERLKTELITNVSHDIKTPLTSIVNYVDLLSKEELEGMPAEYIEVLQRQSARLKKLTEDLVEASKAATGNINVDLKRIDIRETVNQAVGEYSEKLEKADLDVVIDAPDVPVIAEADGRLLWRAIDNLLSNVCKYSMQNTRVYITVSESQNAGVHTDNALHTGIFNTKRGAAAPTAGGKVRIEIKNISRDRLNISAEDLMERFVRGDGSRNSSTEGSGLGLNIAKSLTELQGGKFDLTVDGDLFKAEITLKK